MKPPAFLKAKLNFKNEAEIYIKFDNTVFVIVG